MDPAARGEMELRQLQLLMTVIDAGGFAPAGKVLNVSHSAIHRQIRMLEQELDCRLLVRLGRTVQPTESGRLLADLLVRLQKEIADAERQVCELNNLRKGCLQIGTTSSILVSFLPAVLMRYSRTFPGVRLHIITGIADDLIDDVLEGRLDVAIVFNPFDLPRSMPQLSGEVLYREQFDWAVGTAHPLASRKQVTMTELANHPLITLPPRSHLRRACDRMFAAKGLAPTVITELENEEAIDKLIEINLGFALRLRRRPANTKIRCFPIAKRTLECEVGMMVLDRSHVPRAIAEFTRMCREMKLAVQQRKGRHTRQDSTL